MNGDPSPAHVLMRQRLTEWGWSFVEEERVAGHRIDFVVEGRLGVDVNGDHWHRWPKIVACDRKKLGRVFAANGPIVLGVWYSRLVRDPEGVRQAVDLAFREGRLAFWDWAVPVDTVRVDARPRIKEALGGAGNAVQDHPLRGGRPTEPGDDAGADRGGSEGMVLPLGHARGRRRWSPLVRRLQEGMRRWVETGRRQR